MPQQDTTPKPTPKLTPAMTLAETAELPTVLDLATAARALGIGRTTAYALARRGEFPCPLIRVGGAYRVPTAGVLQVLGLPASRARAGE